MFLETQSLPKAVKKLLIINVGIYIVLRVTGLYGWGIQWFSFIPSQVTQHAELWRLFTYLFLHVNIFWHLVFNMFAIWMFGPEIERRMGTPQFVFYYFLAGIGGALCSLLVSPHSSGVTIGASASIFGLLVAFAMLFPDAVITMIFPPVSMKAKHFAMVFGAIQLLMAFEGPSGIDWIVHVGGMAVGYVYLKFALRDGMHWNWNTIKQKIFQKRRSKGKFDSEEIDRILDKISRSGMDSLSWRERRMLKKAHKNI